MKTRLPYRNSQCNQRTGTAVTELAVILPVILLITVGILGICEGFFLKQKLTLGAHEGARVAIRRSGTTAGVKAAVAEYLDARGVDYGSIDSAVNIVPPVETATVLQPITVEVTVPYSPNSRLPSSFGSVLNGRSVTADVVMFKEFEAQL